MARTALVTGTDDTAEAKADVFRLLDHYKPELIITQNRIGVEYQARAWARAHNVPIYSVVKERKRADFSEYKEWDDEAYAAFTEHHEPILVIASKEARWPLVARCRVDDIRIVEIEAGQIGLFS